VSKNQNCNLGANMKAASYDLELKSLKTILDALEPLDEAQRRFVLKTVTERLGIAMTPGFVPANTGGGGPIGGSATPPAPATGGGGVLNGQTARQFLKTKLPKKDVLRIACLAYYLTHGMSQRHFKTEDLTKLNSDAGGTELSNPSMAVSNATKQNKYLAPVGKGQKQITTLGEDVVEALPDELALAAVLARHKKPRKKTAKRGSAKAK
jgi:hypothetical protein